VRIKYIFSLQLLLFPAFTLPWQQAWPFSYVVVQELIGLKNDMSLVEMIAMTNSIDVQEVIEMKTQVWLSLDKKEN
jgi:hypothetical protein